MCLRNNLKYVQDLQDELTRSQGFEILRKAEGFTVEELYKLSRDNEQVLNISFKIDTESYRIYGNSITVALVFTQKERLIFENVTKTDARESTGYIKARLLVDTEDRNKVNMLKFIGFNSADVCEILFVKGLYKQHNTFVSNELREPSIIKVPFTPLGGGRDAGWIYGFLMRVRQRGVAITPNEEFQYLAYKLLLHSELITEDEKAKIFDEKGAVIDEVARYMLLNKIESLTITRDEIKRIAIILQAREQERISILDKELQSLGTSITKLESTKSNLADFLKERVINFNEIRYNLNGKHVLYLDIHGYLHIYLRHCKEFQINNGFINKNKFQLNEEDIKHVMMHVLHELNEEYQSYKEKNPNGRFSKYGDQSFYYLGDYYTVHVNSDGTISTFYKNDDDKVLKVLGV